MDSRLLLPVHTVLDGAYSIERVLGSGGFGITYAATDLNLGTTVALKEYYPIDFGDRDATMSVRPKSERHKQTFDWGRLSFLEEARMLARFRHASVVRVSRVFEANATAYMVMDYEDGQNLEAWLTGLGRPPTQEDLDRIAAPLLDALEMMHRENFLHRDIAPDNIVVRTDGSPVLLDFGATRRSVAEMSRTMTRIVKAGYSPQEQYAADNRLQGPWSDLYALGATLYRAVAGRPPEEAALRVADDRTPPAAKAAQGKYRPGFLAAIDRCLTVKHTDRPRSVAQLRPMLLGQRPESPPGATHPADIPEAAMDPPRVPPIAPPARPTAKLFLVVAVALLALSAGIYGGLQYTYWDADRQQRKIEDEARHRQQERHAADVKRERTERLAAEERAEEAKKRTEEARAARERAEAESRRQQEERLAAEERAAEARRRAEEERAARDRAEAEIRRQQKEREAAEERAARERADARRERERAEDRAAAERADAIGRISAWIERDFLNDNIAYADMVDWYDQGLIARDAVLKDRAKYLARWPDRKFTLVAGSMQITPIGANRYAATFEQTFVVRNDARKAHAAGKSRLWLDVEMIDGRPHVARQKEVVERQ